MERKRCLYADLPDKEKKGSTANVKMIFFAGEFSSFCILASRDG